MSADISGLWPDEYAAIGEIVVASAYLEGSLELIVAMLARLDDEETRILLGGVMLDKKLAVVEGLGIKRLKRRPARLLEFKKIISDLRHLNSERSVAVHGFWSTWTSLKDLLNNPIPITPPEREARTSAVKYDRDGKQKRLSIRNAKALAGKIDGATERLHFFIFKTWPQLSIIPRSIRLARRAQKRKKSASS